MIKAFLSGPAGTGKTTAGIEYLSEIIESTNDGVLVYLPQKILAEPYISVLMEHTTVTVDVFTIGSLSQEMVELYWPLFAEEVGFSNPYRQPTFLNLEGAQYFVAQVIQPDIDEGLFESVTISRHRLYTQVLDNLNKAALNGYDHREIGSRLQLAVVGDSEQQRIYEDAQFAAIKFREFCLENNLLDFSFQVEIFWKFLWQKEGLCKENLRARYQHILVDNLEELTPIEHEMIRDWFPYIYSGRLIYDIDAGYRTFLGADPDSAYSLMEVSDTHIEFTKSFQMNPSLEVVINRFGKILNRPVSHEKKELTLAEIQEAVIVDSHRFFPEMLDWVTENIVHLVEQMGVSYDQIAVLSPFLSDALRYSLTERLDRFGIPIRSHRPSRSLSDEPVTQAMLTLSMLAHPDWGMTPSSFDVAYMFVQILGNLDLVRAQLLSEIVFRIQDGQPVLSSFRQIVPDMQERITFLNGEKYEYLRSWLEGYSNETGTELDFFLSRIFGEVLSQPGYGFHHNYSAGTITANLIDSIYNFRVAVKDQFTPPHSLGKEYIQMVHEGIIAAQYLRSWKFDDRDAVMLLPAYTFLMQNKAVDYQFWLDIGSYGWHKRIYQPVT